LVASVEFRFIDTEAFDKELDCEALGSCEVVSFLSRRLPWVDVDPLLCVLSIVGVVVVGLMGDNEREEDDGV
jgi:hypothetical protein